MTHKISMGYDWRGERTAGWTENFWNDATTGLDAEKAARQLATLLKPLHGDQSVNTFARVAAVPRQRKSNVIRFQNVPDPDLTKDTSTDFPTNALLLEMYGAGGYTTRQWIKGIPDNQISRGGRFTPTPAFSNDFKRLRLGMLNGNFGWCMRVASSAEVKQDILGITEAGVLNVPANGYALNDRVRVGGVVTPRYANRTWKVKPSGADLLALFGYETQTGIAYSGPGHVRRLSMINVQIVDMELIYATKKNVGRPSMQLGGSHRAK